jgi:AhpC/TSA family
LITILNEQRETSLPNAKASGDSLWLDRTGIEQALGWTWKPEGLCQGDTCVPLPRASNSDLMRDDRLDIAAMWRHMGNPVVHDNAANTWVLGTGSDQRAQTLTSLEAPDFELPGLDGRVHRLSDYRGKKVLLATWASW